MTRSPHTQRRPKPARLPGRLAGAALLSTCLAAGLSCTGCAAHRDSERSDDAWAIAERLPAEAWPERTTDGLQNLVDHTPRQITRLVLDGTLPEDQVAPDLLEMVRSPEAKVTYTGVHGVGIIRVIEPAEGPRRNMDGRPHGPDANRMDPPGTGTVRLLNPPGQPQQIIRFVSFSNLSDRLTDRRFERWSRWLGHAMGDYFRQTHAGVRPNDPRILSMLYEGTRLSLIPPAAGVHPAGLVVHMAGLGSLEWEQPVLDELTRRGWYILRVATPRVWWYEAKPFEINSESDIPGVAQKIAAMIDDVVAEPAYAAEAGLDFLAKLHPEVPRHPLVMLGCSAGALAAPAVVARLPDKFDAVVLVGGGANLLKISQESDLTDAGIRIKWPDDEVRPAWREQLFRQYLQASHLDPYYAARSMLDKPTLMLLASMDSTVPVGCGWLLWERLEKPEHYTFMLGHRFLFWVLGGQANRIADWCDRSVPHNQRHIPAVAQQSSNSNGSRTSQ